MRIAINLFKICLNFIYFFLKLFPTKKTKVLFLSRQSNDLTLDFEKTILKLKEIKEDVEIVTLSHRLEGENDGGLKGILAFGITTLKSMYHLATSKVCVLDAYWPAVSILNHKKDLKVIQMWHALGKIKKSGYQTLDKESGRSADIARLMQMHRKYDFIIAGGKAWNEFYCQSFDTTEDKLVNIGLPRIDYLLETKESNMHKIYEAYPEFANKTVVLYAPTFRRNIELHWKELVDAAQKAGVILIVKGHPNQRLEDENSFAYFCPEFKAVELLSVCDFLVTDYSAIAIEGAILNKPTYYYVYDYDEYRQKNGMNIDLYQVMPGCVFRDGGELMKKLINEPYPMETLQDYISKYLPEDLGTSTLKICQLILEQMK